MTDFVRGADTIQFALGAHALANMSLTRVNANSVLKYREGEHNQTIFFEHCNFLSGDQGARLSSQEALQCMQADHTLPFAG